MVTAFDIKRWQGGAGQGCGKDTFGIERWEGGAGLGGHERHQTLGRGAQNWDAVMKCLALNGGRGEAGQGLEVTTFDIKRWGGGRQTGMR